MNRIYCVSRMDLFIPIGTETLGTFGPEAIKFLEDLGHKLGLINGENPC